MKKTTPTDRNSPAVPFEPAEFIGWLPCISASCGRFETAYMVNNAIGIGKCVLVGALHFDAFIRACYHPVALAAENVFACVRLFLFCFILNNVTGLFTVIFLRRLSKKITCLDIIYNHFLIEIVCYLPLVVSWSFFLNKVKNIIAGKCIFVKFLKKMEGVFDFLRIPQYIDNESDNFDALVKSNVDG